MPFDDFGSTCPQMLSKWGFLNSCNKQRGGATLSFRKRNRLELTQPLNTAEEGGRKHSDNFWVGWIAFFWGGRWRVAADERMEWNGQLPTATQDRGSVEHTYLDHKGPK